MSTIPDPLDPLLDRWSKIPEPRARFSADVWQRIARAEPASGAPATWRVTVEAWFTRLSFVVMFVASCALLGLFLAELRVNHRQRERNDQLARSYLQLIDPLLTAQTEEWHP